MKREIVLSDFYRYDVSAFRFLAKKPRTRSYLYQFLPPTGVHQLVLHNVLIEKIDEQTGLKCYVFRDGFIDG